MYKSQEEKKDWLVSVAYGTRPMYKFLEGKKGWVDWLASVAYGIRLFGNSVENCTAYTFQGNPRYCIDHGILPIGYSCTIGFIAICNISFTNSCLRSDT